MYIDRYMYMIEPILYRLCFFRRCSLLTLLRFVRTVIRGLGGLGLPLAPPGAQIKPIRFNPSTYMRYVYTSSYMSTQIFNRVRLPPAMRAASSLALCIVHI